MPKLKRKLPSYRLHKVSGQAVVTLNGRDHYLGPHGSPESYEEYKRLIGEWTAVNRLSPLDSGDGTPRCNDLRICELVAAYCEHAKGYYVKNGQPTGEYGNIQDAIRPLERLLRASVHHTVRPCRPQGGSATHGRAGSRPHGRQFAHQAHPAGFQVGCGE
jgi:hypothetical protein